MCLFVCDWILTLMLLLDAQASNWIWSDHPITDILIVITTDEYATKFGSIQAYLVWRVTVWRHSIRCMFMSFLLIWQYLGVVINTITSQQVPGFDFWLACVCYFCMGSLIDTMAFSQELDRQAPVTVLLRMSTDR